MNEEHCCGADREFDLKSAEKEYAGYLKRGPKKSTQRLIDALSGIDPENRTLLDIGGGIGAIAWEFHARGAAGTMDVDASNGYLEVAGRHAEKMGWEANSGFLFGDITEINGSLAGFDFVTMDKVICCYPDYPAILKTAMSHCDDVLALTFPLGGPVAHFLLFWERLFLKLKRNHFQPYIHPYKKIEELILAAGFKPVHQSVSFPWRVWVFRKC